VTRRVFLDSRRDNLAHWYTFGAGMTPLNMLHPRSLAKASSTWVVRANKVLLYTAATLLAALALDLIPGLHIGTWDLLAHAVRDVNWRTLVPGLMLFVSAVGLLARHNGPPLTLKMRASTLEKWSDFFGSEDPVPGGSFINRFGQLRKFRPSQHRIFNTRVAVLDHNRYWTNIEQFVAPIAMDLLHLMGAGGDKAREQGALDEAARRRDLRTWWNMVISVTALVACAISALWTAFGPAHRGVIWAEQARLAWSQGSGVLKRLPPFWHDGFVGTLLSDLWLPCLIVLGLAGWWGVMTWLGIRSRKALVRDLAAAARRSAP